jgi:uncharacterized membrane protein YsdA (DUF1294 family)/cold shock CspA family protein
MRRQGRIVRWDGDKGFGFIRGDGAGAELFFHVRNFQSARGMAPALNLQVSFEEIHVGGKGPRAMAVRPCADEARGAAAPRQQASAPRSTRRPAQRSDAARRASPGTVFWLLATGYGVALGAAVWRGLLPWWVLPASLLLNLFTFYVYWLDKHAAATRRWRVAENTLHLWSLAGGWAGAWYAQQVLRHKSRKQPFRAVYWMTVLLHGGALAAFCLRNA